MSSIHPPSSEAPSSQPIVYEIVVSEQLPCFDPTISIKHLFMSREKAVKLGRFALHVKPVLVPVYLAGLVLRIVNVLVPVHVGEILAVLSSVFQFPAILLAISAFRYEYVKVIAHTFEFYFLALTATLWVACCFVSIQDLRAVLLPIVWVDFIDLVLIEAYFGDPKTILLIAIASGLYLMLLTGKISLSDGDESAISSQAMMSSASQSDQIDSLTVKDALANAMGTMVMLVVRLAYRKHEIMKRGRQEGTSWTQSIGYRCRIALRSAATPAASSNTNPVQELVQQRPSAAAARRLPMRFIAIPALFHSDHTVYQTIASSSELKRWQATTLYGCGVVGYTVSTLVMVVAASKSNGLRAGIGLPVAAITSLSLTIGFWLYFLSCCQRQLLRQLWTSFDFVFLFVQLIASDV
ncbi:hypothetical protein Gpo141_00009024, partial [Globisporangium polare]